MSVTGGNRRKLKTRGQEGTFGGDESVIFLCCGGGYMSICICQNSSTVHLKG